jgi:phospholipase C
VPQSLFQEGGVRSSRALPYELQTSARAEALGTLSLIFSNTGRQGAVFHVYDKFHLDRIPRRYTVEAGKTLTDVWNVAATDRGNYDVWVYGTNGYVRSFLGNTLTQASAGFKPEVQISYGASAGEIYLRVYNAGTVGGQVVITSNAYRTDGPWTLHVPAHSTGMRLWNLEESSNWYDFTVQSAGFESRFAGRVETGRNSFSDPAMGQDLAVLAR